MPLASITFLSPGAGLVALAVVLPLAALVLAEQRVAAARALLRLPAPGARGRWPTIAALMAVPVLLGLAATQPAIRTLHGTAQRTDAEAVFVLDISRSMAASASPGATTRLARARAAAIRLRAAVPEVPAGVATLTDRVLPELLPIGDTAAFDSTVRATEIEKPPPHDVNVTATTFQPLANLASQGYFSPSARRRLVVVLTDGEARPSSADAIARALRRGPGVSLLLVHVWAGGDRVYRRDGRPEVYRPDPQSASTLAALASATRGRVVPVADLGAAERAERAAIGAGPVEASGRERRTTTLAPYVAAAALVPLLLLLRRRNVPHTIATRVRAT